MQYFQAKSIYSAYNIPIITPMNKIVSTLLLLIATCACHDADFNEVVDMPATGESNLSIIDNETKFYETFGDSGSMTSPVDFGRYNIVVATGVSPYGIASITHKLEGNLLTVRITLTLAAVMEPWQIAHIIPRDISPDSIRLAVVYD